MSWSLIREIGIDYTIPAQQQVSEYLVYPSAFQQGTNGIYLIVDEFALGKYLSITAKCRTIIVDEDKTILYDSTANGINDGYGCFMDDNDFALLLRTHWELLLISKNWQITRRIDLSTISKGMPRLVCWTWKKTFLLAFLKGKTNVEIIEIDTNGRIIWFLRQQIPLGIPGSIQLTPNNNILLTDESQHMVFEFQRDGSLTWDYGEIGNPSANIEALSSPKSARQTPTGNRIIADTRNNRIISIKKNNEINYISPSDGDLCSPSFCDTSCDGNYLVCDAGNKRVIKISPDGDVLWQYGQQIGTKRWFAYPRSVELNENGEYLIADTANNRIIKVAGDKILTNAFEESIDLFWPRCVRKLKNGGYLIADGRNSRIVELSKDGYLRNELKQIRITGDKLLQDPHDVRLLANGNLLIVDSSANQVIESDWSGRVIWLLGTDTKIELNDPHSAQMLANGDVVICDSGNNRIIRINRRNEIKLNIEAVEGESCYYKLSRPRYAEISRENTLVIADSNNNRILAAGENGDLIWELSNIPQSPMPSLSQPRWVHMINRNEIIISDHLNHRIVHLKASFDNN